MRRGRGANIAVIADDQVALEGLRASRLIELQRTLLNDLAELVAQFVDRVSGLRQRFSAALCTIGPLSVCNFHECAFDAGNEAFQSLELSRCPLVKK